MGKIAKDSKIGCEGGAPSCETIPYWRRNLFTIPSGAIGKKIAATMTDLLQKWTQKSEWEKISLDAATVFLPLILQKSGAKVNAKEAKNTITQRLEKWNSGDVASLLDKCIKKDSTKARRIRHHNMRRKSLLDSSFKGK